MKVIEQYPNGVSVIEKNGAYMVHDEHNAQSYDMLCKSCEEAIHHARIASWNYLAYDYQEQMRSGHFGTIMSSVCGTCPFRETTGCIGKDCPVHHLQDEINNVVKLIAKTRDKLRRQIDG